MSTNKTPEEIILKNLYTYSLGNEQQLCECNVRRVGEVDEKVSGEDRYW